MTSRHCKGLSSEEISLVMMWRMSLNEYNLSTSVEQLCQMALQGPEVFFKHEYIIYGYHKQFRVVGFLFYYFILEL